MEGVTGDLSGDFRQTLQSIPTEKKADEFRACLKFVRDWQHVKTIKQDQI